VDAFDDGAARAIRKFSIFLPDLIAAANRGFKPRPAHGKTLVAVDFSDIRHKPASVVRRVDFDMLRARVAELEELVSRAEAIAARQRADYERERERAEQLASEIVRVFAELIAAKEKAARLEGEIAALRARPWWLRPASYIINYRIRGTPSIFTKKPEGAYFTRRQSFSIRSTRPSRRVRLGPGEA
jgi:hypothetical protein